MSLVERLDEAFNQREKKWPTHTGGELDRKTVLSSSEALRCLRHSWFEKHDAEVDEGFEEDWGYAIRGHGVEAYIIDALKQVMDDGEELHYTGDEQISFVDHGGKVSATPDGLYVAYDDDDIIETTCMLEIKSIDPRTNWNNLPKAPHVAQTNIAMGLLNRLSEWEVKRARLIYVDASQFTKQVEYVIEYDGGKALENAEVRAKRLFEANDAQQLPAEGAMSGGCKFCPYKTACGAASDDAKYKKDIPAQVGSTSNTDGDAAILEVTARQYAAVDQRMKSDKALLAELKTEIINMMDGREEANFAGIAIKATSQAGRRTLDRKKLEEAYGDLSQFEKVGSPSVRLSIKET